MTRPSDVTDIVLGRTEPWAKRGFNLCLWMSDNAEKLIFEILPHSIFYYSQYRQYIWADLVALALALLFGLPSKILCGRISKMSFLHYPNIHKHGLTPLLACTFCICKAPFSRCVKYLLIVHVLRIYWLVSWGILLKYFDYFQFQLFFNYYCRTEFPQWCIFD